MGVTLPSFRHDTAAVASARRAEELGLDGVFVFDHLWPMGRPDRPALSCFPLLAAVAASTSDIHVGPLVARVGTVSDDLLIAQFLTLAAMAPQRVVAALGTGDAKSADENRAYGIPYPPAGERRLAVARCARQLQEAGLPVWIGGGARPTVELARDLSAAVNLWGAQPAAVASLAARFEVTWGGPVSGSAAVITEWLVELAAAGATWAVCAWPGSLEAVAEAAQAVR